MVPRVANAEQLDMAAHLTWKSYVTYCTDRGNIDELMIVSAVDGSHWASTNDFMVKSCNTRTINKIPQ